MWSFTEACRKGFQVSAIFPTLNFKKCIKDLTIPECSDIGNTYFFSFHVFVGEQIKSAVHFWFPVYSIFARGLASYLWIIITVRRTVYCWNCWNQAEGWEPSRPRWRDFLLSSHHTYNIITPLTSYHQLSLCTCWTLVLHNGFYMYSYEYGNLLTLEIHTTSWHMHFKPV